MDTGNLISIFIGITSVIVTLAATYFAFVIRITNRVTKLETRTEVFWKVLEPHLANIIHSPNHQRRDALVEKLVTKGLNLRECDELIPLLQECYGTCDKDKKVAAALLLARVISERGHEHGNE